MNENQNANMSRKEYNKLQAKQTGNSSSVFDGKEFLLRLASIELPSGSTTIWDLPNGYIFKDENGNVINATKIVLEKKKKEYPKTYDECCKVMNYCCNPVAVKTTHKEELIRKFQFLLMYRDAYWKIAGEEMGLGKPWEIDPHKPCYFIAHLRTGGIIKKLCGCVNGNANFAFPTPEMRDAFYENFKEEIEICKELL